MQNPLPNPASRLSWLWAIVPLLLAATLAIPLLDVDAFNGDEPASLAAAGILGSGPRSLADIWDFLAENDPRNAPGWPILLSVWGPFVGWSEFAIRALSLFIGLLTLAWVFRSGRGLFTCGFRCVAAWLFRFFAYMVNARAYTLVTLCATICLWRVALHNTRQGRAGWPSAWECWTSGRITLVLCSCPRWVCFICSSSQRTTLVACGAPLRTRRPDTIVQPILFEGLNIVVSEDLLDRILPATGILSHLLRYMTNGLVDPSPPFSELLLLALPLVPVIVTLRHLRKESRVSAIWLLVFTSTALLVMVIVINEFLRVIVDNRIRYLMPLWPLTALLAGASLWRLANKHRILVAGMLALWLISGAWLVVATDFRYELGYFFSGNYHHVSRVMQEHLSETDLIIFDRFAVPTNRDFFSFRMLGLPLKIVRRYLEDPYENVRPVHAAYPYIWLLYLSKDRVGFADLPQALGRVLCERVLDDWGFTLERYALHSVENCPDKPVRLAFDSDIHLIAPEISFRDGLLRLDAHFRSADDYLLSYYSLAVHVIDQSGERVAQGDTGIGPGAIVPLRSEIDVSALPTGDYELRVALYDWQTDARLPARDTVTGEVGDMHTLQRFRLG